LIYIPFWRGRKGRKKGSGFKDQGARLKDCGVNLTLLRSGGFLMTALLRLFYLAPCALFLVPLVAELVEA
jgi:hypothetical protein